MTRDQLMNDPKWLLSEYEEKDYFLKSRELGTGSNAYVYDKEDEKLIPLEIVHSIARSDDPDAYDDYGEDALIDGEAEYGADLSCELITDDDSYLIWFVIA